MNYYKLLNTIFEVIAVIGIATLYALIIYFELIK